MSRQFDYHYNVYLDNCFALARTMIIRNMKQAQDMNLRVLYRTGKPETRNPEHWIYFKHVCGEYHETDRPMYVVSVDNMEKIVFSKDNLRLHKNTKKEYAYGSHMYEELLERYPENELLIKGILNPADLNTALESKDGTILSYDKSLVEMNEYSLMEKLQNTIYRIFNRWYQKQYNINHSQYNFTFLGILYQKLVEAIMDIRLEHCLTNEAHSYHYRRYLASHGFLDYYVDHMTIKQTLILYKNIRWVEIYIGQKRTQQWLIKHILTLRNLPLSEYNTIQVYNNIVDEIKAVSRFEKKSLNGLESIDNLVDTLSLNQMMNREEPMAPFNPTYREQEEKEAKNLLSSSLSSEMKTKILESKVTDFTDSEDHTLPNILLDQWIDMADKNIYRAYITIAHPLTGEIIPLNAKNALLLYTYTVQMANGINDDCIPDFLIQFSPRKNRPTLNELKELAIKPELVQESWLQTLLENYSPLRPVMNTVDFYLQAEERFETLNRLLDLAKQDGNIDATAYKMVQVYNLFHTRKVSFRTSKMMKFSQFLTDLTFDTKGLKPNDYKMMANNIWYKMVGLSTSKRKSINDISKAMIGLMTKLSSYSVHYIRMINEVPLTALRMRSMRIDDFGNKHSYQETEMFGSNFPVTLDIETHPIQILDEEPNYGNVGIDDATSSTETTLVFDINPKVDVFTEDPMLVFETECPTGTYIMVEEEDLTGLSNPMGYNGIPGMRSWLSLPEETQNKILTRLGGPNDWQPTLPNTNSVRFYTNE